MVIDINFRLFCMRCVNYLLELGNRAVVDVLIFSPNIYKMLYKSKDMIFSRRKRNKQGRILDRSSCVPLSRGSKGKTVWKLPKKQTRYQLMDQPTNRTIIIHNTKHLSRILRITGTGYNNNCLRIS